MPQFQIIRERLSAEFPEVEHSVYSNTGGDLTPHPWHVMGVSCLIHRDWDNPPNEVMIQVVLLSLKSQPKVEANVMWDYTMASVYDLFPHSIPVSEEAITSIEKALPKLLEALKEEVRRGKPPKSLAEAET